MRRAPFAGVAFVTATALGQTMTIDFDQDAGGKPPVGWTATQTGSGRAIWTVIADDTAPSRPNVLKQSGQATYPVCIKDDTSIKDRKSTRLNSSHRCISYA